MQRSTSALATITYINIIVDIAAASDSWRTGKRAETPPTRLPQRQQRHRRFHNVVYIV